MYVFNFKDTNFTLIIYLHWLLLFEEVTSYDYIIIDYLHISFHGIFVELEDVDWKRDKNGNPQIASLIPQKLSGL
jgi:hypothetical protein